MKNYILLLFFLPSYVFSQTPSGDTLPAPFATKSTAKYSNVIGWENGRTPTAPAGFKVTKYAEGFENPRWMYVMPNGDILVAQSNSNYSIPKQVGAKIIGAGASKDLGHSSNIITLLRDADKDGIPEIRETFLTEKEGLKQPFGMLVMDNWLYVANTDAIIRYPYTEENTRITAQPETIGYLPAGEYNQHWTRNIISNKAHTKIYVAVGSGSNIAENGIGYELMRANILEMNPDGSAMRVFASGLRNPVGMDWEPESQVLWTAVNERDGLGDNLVPDYLTAVVEDAFYGWPYVYIGNHPDPRVEIDAPQFVENTKVPDILLGSHTASLGLCFYNGKSFPEKYRKGAFVVQHGSWNREILSGYRVIFVPFENGKPTGAIEDFLTGFIVEPNTKNDKVYGRPVGAVTAADGSLLITDDVTNTIWRIQY